MLVCCLCQPEMLDGANHRINGNIFAAKSTPWFLHGSTIQIHSTNLSASPPTGTDLSPIEWPKCVCIRRAWWRRPTASNSHELRRNSPGKRAPRQGRNHKNRRHTFVWINGIYEPQQKSWLNHGFSYQIPTDFATKKQWFISLQVQNNPSKKQASFISAPPF